MSTPKIFGREPAVVAGLIEAALAVLVSFGLLNFVGIDGAEGLAVVMAVVTAGFGTYVAFVTKDTLLGVSVALIKAVIALLAYYKYDLDQQQVMTLVAAVSLGVGFFQRTQTGPAVVPSFSLDQHSVDIPPSGEATETVPAVNAATGALVEKPVAADSQEKLDEMT